MARSGAGHDAARPSRSVNRSDGWYYWWGGLPGAYVGSSGKATRPKKQDTTICPLTTATDRDVATEWVREALTTGQMRWYEGDQDFPNHIWYKQRMVRSGLAAVSTAFRANAKAG